VAAGTFLAVGKMMTRPDAPAPAPEPPPVAEPQGKAAPEVDMTALLAEADGLLKEEKWSEASKVYSRALQEEPEQAAALEGRKRATAEAANERKYQELLKDADQAQWHDAFFALEDFPKDSVYASRLDEVRAKVQGGFASGELERGKALLEQGKVDGARQVQVALAEKPFAASEARSLERAIRGAVAAEEAERVREERAARVAEAPPPGPPPPPPRAERRRPRPERAKPARKPVNSDAEYDELMNQAVRMVARGKRAQAVRALEKAHRLKPNDHLPHQRLCAIYPPLGQLEKALRHCKLWLGKEKTGAYKPQIRTRIQQLEEELNR
jgi:tetratricopeptide (TPR) repeat protein